MREEGTELIPSLKEVIQTGGLNEEKMTLAFPLPEDKGPPPRSEVFVTDGERTVTWPVA